VGRKEGIRRRKKERKKRERKLFKRTVPFVLYAEPVGCSPDPR
jgi:hypothetical protein